MEKWEKWVPREGMPIPSDIKSVVLDDEGLVVTMADETKKKKLTFSFEGTVYSYRFTDESCFLKTLHYLKENYDDDFVHGTTLYKVENSNYLESFKEESYGAYDNVKHYVFYTADDVLEVLSPYPPKVTLKDI